MPKDRQEDKKKGRAPERIGEVQGASDRRGALEVFGRAFTNTDGLERHLTEGLWRGGIADPEHTRVAVVDGRVVSLVVLGPRRMRFGPLAVPAMTVGPVCTHDKERRHGYAAAAMNEASEYMAANGVVVAYLQGISDFYHRFDYYPYMAPPRVGFEREAAKKEATDGKLRAMSRADLPRVAKLYDQATVKRLGAADRDRATWDWLLAHGRRTWLFQRPRVILDGGGKLCGYLTMKAKGDLNITEIVLRQDEAACRAALGAIVREARQRETRKLSLPIPYDDALAVFLRQFVGGDFTSSSNAAGGALLKIVDFAGLMAALGPLLDERWRAAGGGLPGAKFTLASDIGEVGLAVGRQGARVRTPRRGDPRVVVPPRWLSGLATGYYTTDDVAPRKGVAVPAQLLPAMRVLFPRAWPYVYQGDNY